MLLLAHWAINGTLSPPAVVAGVAIMGEVRVTAEASAGATSLTVSPLRASLPPGTVMSFNGVQVVTTSWEPAGSTSVAVNSTSGIIVANARAQALAENIVLVRRVSPTMPAPVLVDGRPSGTWVAE